MSVHINFLLRFPLLCELPHEVLAGIAAQMTLRSFARRATVMHKGETNQGLGFLLEGHLQGVDFTLDGREVGLYFISPGDYFGELAVADRQASPEFVIALAKSEILFLPGESTRQQLFSIPAVATAVMLRLAWRVRTGTAQRNLLSLPNPMQRLCAQLLLMCAPPDDLIVRTPTHQELAIMVNTTRETVTRNFQVLQTRGLLVRQGDTLVVADRCALQMLAEGKAT